MTDVAVDHIDRTIKRASFINGVLSLIITIITALSVCYGFYYETKSKQEQHSISIREVKADVNEIKQIQNSAAVFQGVTQSELKTMKEWMIRMEDKMDVLIEMQARSNHNNEKDSR